MVYSWKVYLFYFIASMTRLPLQKYQYYNVSADTHVCVTTGKLSSWKAYIKFSTACTAWASPGRGGGGGGGRAPLLIKVKLFSITSNMCTTPPPPPTWSLPEMLVVPMVHSQNLYMQVNNCCAWIQPIIDYG